jgi:ubiquinone/menaquinone biosynthesis C-methylase UbiE
LSRDREVWNRTTSSGLFARAMAPMMAMPARTIAEQVAGTGTMKVLDIAAGHGVFGIAIAQANPQAEITAVDWASVLEVAKENAVKAGVSARFHALPGSAFDVEFGSDYDLFLRKVCAALKPAGKAVTLEFCPNEDRVTPLSPARFAITMLQSTAHGDAYTFPELDSMFRNAGFSSSERQLLPSEQSAIVSSK